MNTSKSFLALPVSVLLAAIPAGLGAAEATPTEPPAAEPAPPTSTAGEVPAPVSVADFAARRRAAGAAQPAPLQRFGGAISLGAGYDSNVVLLEDQNQVVTELDGFALSAAASGIWRAVARDETRINVMLTAADDEYPDHDEQRLLRVGGQITGLFRWRSVNPGFVVGADRFIIDGEGAATAISASATVASIRRDHVDIAGVEAMQLDYDDIDSASGTLVLASYRHWFLLQPFAARRRVEASVRAGAFRAGTDDESYLTLRPALGWSWRFGAERARGTWDLATALEYELRVYDEAVPSESDAEVAHLAALGAETNWWLSSWLAAGAYARISARSSNIDNRDYSRFQVGLRLTATY
ncbi:MAG: hypothetical protein H0W72_12850 [Planctomycetes bacterium]|nr:hypothetical protein [Planctomycetota bacterium]